MPDPERERLVEAVEQAEERRLQLQRRSYDAATSPQEWEDAEDDCEVAELALVAYDRKTGGKDA